MSLQSAVYGFVPTSITGCALWLDGADPAGTGVVPGTGTLATWIDKSGNGFNASSQLTAATSTQNAVNGLNSISFNGTSRYLTSVTGFNNSAYTIFVVQYTTSITGAGGSSGYQRTVHGSTGNQYVFIGTYNGNVATFSGSGSAWNDVAANSTNVYNYNSSRIVCMQVSGSILSPYTDGSSQTTKTGTTGSFSSFYIGNDNANTQPWYGFISEIIMYNSAFGNTQRQQVEGYLAQKWGLTSSLPVGHPGRSTTIYRSDYTKQNVMTALPYYAAFTPRQISGCALWLDAADPAGNGVVPANGATVSTWVDKSGNANNGTSGTATFNRDSVGGFINFTGGQTYSITNPNVVVNQYFTIFVVEQLQNYAGGEAAFMGGNGSFNANLHMRYTTGGGGMKFGFFGNDLDASVTAFLTNSTQPVRIWSFSFLPSSRVIYLNGTSIGSDTNNIQISGWGGAAIGAMVSYGGQYYNGKMREVMIFSGSLLTAQRQQVESYLAQKWGLTASLPGGHSHATQPAGALTTTALTNFRILSRLRTSQFLPTSIAGLQMWMDAADSSADSMTLSGSTVTVWKDKSGLGNHTTARSGTSTLTSNAINGKSAISMAGGYFTGPFSTANTGTQVHAFAVMTIDSSSGLWPRPLALGRPGVNDYSESTTTFAIIRYSGTQAVGIGRAGQYLSVGIPAYSSPFLVQSSHNGATEYMGVNGTLTPSSAGTGQSGNFNITSYGLGVNTNTNDYFVWNGYYAEVMYFNVQLSDANRQKIEGYLAWKWGLQALLPGGHPHASATP